MSRDRKVYLISSFLIQSMRKAASRIVQRDNRNDRTAQLNDNLAYTFYVGCDERLNGEIMSDVRKQE